MGAVYLIRHGQASFGAADYDRLSTKGITQCALLGAELLRRGLTFTSAHCGSMERQRDTAAAALEILDSDLSVTLDPRWNEYDHNDILAKHAGPEAEKAGDGPREFQQALERALSRWIHAGADSPCAETWPGFLNRVREVLGELVARLGRGEHAVVFTSGGVIAALCGLLLEEPEAVFQRLNRVTVNTGITKLVSGRGGVNLLSFNEHPHFEGVAAKLLTYR